MLSLQRMDRARFDVLLTQWRPHFDNNDDLLYEHCQPHLTHAERIVDEDPVDQTYGIFGLIRTIDGREVYEGFTHINHKLPRTPHAEVRLVWNTLSPAYEIELQPERLAAFTYAYLAGAVRLANSAMKANSVRVYLGNATDVEYARGIVAAMRHQSHAGVEVAMAGNWLHIAGVTGLTL